MDENTNRIGDSLLKLGYISKKQLEIALKIQEKNNALIGNILVQNRFLSEQQLAEYITNSQFSKIGEYLIYAKAITSKQLKKAIKYQQENGGRLGNILVSLGFINQKALDDYLNLNSQNKLPIGKMLVENNEITNDQLTKALDLQRKSGGRLGDILLFLGFIKPERLYRYLATQNSVGRVGKNFDVNISKKLPYDLALKYNAIIINSRNDSYVIAVKELLNEEQLKEIKICLDKPVEQVLATIFEIDNFWNIVYRHKQNEQSVFKLYDEQPENSAIVTFSKPQLIILIITCIVILLFMIANYKATLLSLNLFFQSIYAFMTVLKLYIVLKGSYKDKQLHFTEEEIESIDEKKLPVYTILIPVYKEKEVIQSLIKNIQNIDYPQYKLDVCILLEEDDDETIDAIKKMNLPEYYSAVIVPNSIPKTKPKACNYGLIRARGKYVVIYDAEDRPESDQLKKVYLSFKNLPDSYVCIQSKLNYFNSNQNFLTRLFTQEYSMWFELLLVGIMQIETPIPLGGTSNHFKIEFLKEVGAWDPFNVTEDADLGVRLFKKGYNTAVVDSRTWEEANSDLPNWIRQRSRWIKGYMQTWLVHMRHPMHLYKSLGLKGFIGYQAMILGTPLLPLINPIFWLMLILWYTTKASWIKIMFPGAFYYIAAFQLFFGNFMFTYTNGVGMYWVIRDCSLKNRQPFSYRLVKYSLMSPVYWILMSVAAYKALIQLIVKPFYWEKTNHGLTEMRDKSIERNNVSF
jgi:cellulose synthase/poly-beta-1,6-N-acetylglucosamine synthase-like glycosyltransferase